MEKLVEYACILLISAIFSVFMACAAVYLWARYRLKGVIEGLASQIFKQAEQIQAINENFEAEEEARKATYSDAGRQGAAAKAESDRQIAEATEAGRAVLAGPEPIEKKKELILGLIQQYPKAAVRVATKLNREFGISKMLGMPEAEFFQIVGDLAAKALRARPEAAAGPAQDSPIILY